MTKKKLLIVFTFFISLTVNSFSIEPDIFVQSTVNRASKLLGENITKEKKIEELKLIAKDTVDIRGIGFYTLGSKRKTLTNEEKDEYIILFEKYFLKNLGRIGYIRIKKKDPTIKKSLLITAFQRRYRQGLINGICDQECLIISQNLLKS